MTKENQSIFTTKIMGTTRSQLLERMQVEIAMMVTGGNKTKAAQFWGWTTKTLYNKLEKFNLSKEWKFQKSVTSEQILEQVNKLDVLFDTDPFNVPEEKKVINASERMAQEHIQRTANSYWWVNEATDQEKLETIQRIRSLY